MDGIEHFKGKVNGIQLVFLFLLSSDDLSPGAMITQVGMARKRYIFDLFIKVKAALVTFSISTFNTVVLEVYMWHSDLQRFLEEGQEVFIPADEEGL